MSSKQERERRGNIEMDFKAIGKRIRALRKKAGITQRELAEAAGVSREFITVLEAGYRIPTITTLCGIAEKK